MAPPDFSRWSLKTEVFGNEDGKLTADYLPAIYHYRETDGRLTVGDPVEDTSAFLKKELSVSKLDGLLKHLWFAGAKRPALALHSHVAIGREIVVFNQMDRHLLWTNEERLFVKPVPRFLLSPAFCRSNLQCPDGCTCQAPVANTCMGIPRKVALGFLYTYACLISSEIDFHIANEKRLLPRKDKDEPMEWANWKSLAREILQMYEHDPDAVHPRFLRAELRLSRINTVSRLTSLPLPRSYFRSRHNYGSLFRDNLAWMATAAVFVALVLTAMQVGLSTERLREDATFQQASSVFTILAILGPIGVFALVIIRALLSLVKDLPMLLGAKRKRTVADQTA